MSQSAVKQEDDIDVVDVAGDVPDAIQLRDTVAESMSQPRLRRTRRSNTRYANDYIAEPDVIADQGHAPVRQSTYHSLPEMEMEIEEDVQMIQRTAQTNRRYGRNEIGDNGPVEHRFASSQRKRDVIVYNSRLFPDRASEWYFARKNATTQNETYRCVQCRRYREEVKRGIRVDEYNRPEARIMVHQDRFMNNPDEPLGEHICDFANNDRTLLHKVWTKRVLSKANSELRLKAVKPKQKFDDIIRELRHGTEYDFLPIEVREKIIDEMCNTGKGFNSRRRSFARNNSYYRQHTIKDDEYDGLDEGKYVRHVRFLRNDEELKQYQDEVRRHHIIRGDELVVADEQEVASDHRVYQTVRTIGDIDGPQYEVIYSDHGEDLDPEQHRYLVQTIRDHAFVVLNDVDRRKEALEQLRSTAACFEDLADLNTQPQTSAEQSK